MPCPKDNIFSSLNVSISVSSLMPRLVIDSICTRAIFQKAQPGLNLDPNSKPSHIHINQYRLGSANPYLLKNTFCRHNIRLPGRKYVQNLNYTELQKGTFTCLKFSLELTSPGVLYQKPFLLKMIQFIFKRSWWRWQLPFQLNKPVARPAIQSMKVWTRSHGSYSEVLAKQI